MFGTINLLRGLVLIGDQVGKGCPELLDIYSCVHGQMMDLH